LQHAIDSAHERGGGTVHVPAGRYLCYSLILKCRVSLWLDNGATPVMSPDDADFLPVAKLDYDPRQIAIPPTFTMHC
jgi:polygalacturonase